MAQPPPYGMSPPVVSVVPIRFGPEPQPCVCNNCGKEVRTDVRVESTTKTHLFAVLLCLLFCPCVCLPYCMDSCRAKNHYCPSCGQFLGNYDA